MPSCEPEMVADRNGDFMSSRHTTLNAPSLNMPILTIQKLQTDSTSLLNIVNTLSIFTNYDANHWTRYLNLDTTHNTSHTLTHHLHQPPWYRILQGLFEQQTSLLPIRYNRELASILLYKCTTTSHIVVIYII